MSKSSTSNISFARSESQAFRTIEKDLMSRAHQSKSSCYKNALKITIRGLMPLAQVDGSRLLDQVKGIMDDQNQ